MALVFLMDGLSCGFKERYGIRQVVKHGESASVVFYHLAMIEKGRAEMKKITSKYSLKDIYNCTYSLIPIINLIKYNYQLIDSSAENFIFQHFHVRLVVGYNSFNLSGLQFRNNKSIQPKSVRI